MQTEIEYTAILPESLFEPLIWDQSKFSASTSIAETTRALERIILLWLGYAQLNRVRKTLSF